MSGLTVRNAWPFLGWLVVCTLLLVLVFERRGTADEEAGAPSTSSADDDRRWTALEQRLATLEGRLTGVESAQRAAQTEALWREQKTESAEQQPSSPSSAEAPTPWPSLDEPGSITGKPVQVSAESRVAVPGVEPLFSEKMQEILARVEENPILANRDPAQDPLHGAEDAAGGPASPASGDPVGQPGGSSDNAALGEGGPAKDGDVETILALNRLLVDTGLQRYKAITAYLPAEPGRGLHALSLVERSETGETTGSLHAGTLKLRYFQPRRARFILEQCYGMRGEVRVEFPYRRLEIEIPGVLDPGIVDSRIAAALWEPDSELAERAVAAAHSAVIAFNDVLGSVENVAMRFRSVDRLRNGAMEQVIIDLEFDADGEPVRTVEAASAWWELHEASACVQLHCRGGILVVGGKSRPLFRDHFSHTFGNVQPQVWSRLPAVRVVGADG